MVEVKFVVLAIGILAMEATRAILERAYASVAFDGCVDTIDGILSGVGSHEVSSCVVEVGWRRFGRSCV